MKEAPYKGHRIAVRCFEMIDDLVSITGAKKCVPGVRWQKNVVYDQKRGLKGDLYFPEIAGKYPVFVNIHGGGFIAGDKKFRTKFCSEIARLGYVVFNANYTTCNVEPYPAFLRDCLNALAFLERNADKYGIDVDKLVIGGDSAGAYMTHALGVALTNASHFDGFGLNIPRLTPRALIMLCGLYSLPLSLKNKIAFRANEKVASYVIGCDVNEPWTEKTKDKIDRLNTLSAMTKDFPASFVSETANDPLCGGHAKLLIEKLDEFSVPYEHYKEERAMHCWHLLPGKKARRVTCALHEFLKRLF